jgi:hypothetical protein
MIEPRFFETYNHADVITTVVEDPSDHLNLWHEFFCDGAAASFVAPYRPESAFHTLIGFIIDRSLYDTTTDVDLDHQKALANSFKSIPEALDDIDPFTLPVERALRARRLEYESFVDWLQSHDKTFGDAEPDDIYDYFVDLRLCGPYEELITQSTREVFFTMFANRTLLLRFNEIVAHYVQDLVPQDHDEELRKGTACHFERSGVLRRAYMPEWVRRAVFFRDRGRCVRCQADLSGMVSLWSEENFDHMVPLASGGLNDVTNIQLLCATCNKRKADGEAFTSGTYEDWYSIAEPSAATSAQSTEGKGQNSTVTSGSSSRHTRKCKNRSTKDDA